MQRLDTIATVVTPERVRLRYRLAGPGRRGVAFVLDGLLRAVFLLFVGLALLLVFAVPGFTGAASGLFLLVLFLLEWFYGAFFETILSGRTPGKMAMSLRVVREDGSPARLPDFVLRNLLRVVDYMPGLFGVALVCMWADRKFRRVGDLVAGTVVVVEERGRMFKQVEVVPPVTDEERQGMPARIELTRQELEAVEAYLRRRPRLSKERAEELASLFGPTLADRTGLQAPTWDRVLALAYARHTGKDR